MADQDEYKLGDLKLTYRQVRALYSLIDERANAIQRAYEKQKEDKAAEDLSTRRYYRVRELAKDTARQHARLIGIPPEALAEAAYDAWLEHDGCSSPYDVDDRFDPHVSAEFWRETWINAYVDALPA